MKKEVVRIYAVFGMIFCIMYLLLCIGLTISFSGDIWDYSHASYNETGDWNNVEYVGWAWEEVEAINVLAIALVAISFIIPRFLYFLRLWKSGMYSFMLIDVHGRWSQAWCLLYDLLNLSVTFSLLIAICCNNSGAVEGEIVDRFELEGILFILYLIAAAPVYWISSCIIKLCRRPKLKLLAKATGIAREAHEGQTDKSGMPYIGHAMRVMQAGQTFDERITGVLHDVVEDSDWTFERLLAEGFPPRIVDALRCVTKLSDDEPYDHFIGRVKTNPLARAVKINDLTDNMNIRRYDEMTDCDIKRVQKYLKAYHELATGQS